MKAHVSWILLGVEDMDRSKRFYTEVSAGRSSRTAASRCSSSRRAARSSASTATMAGPPQ
jgi:predicted enzyme related to lactoylglutathione lyase